MRVLLAVALLTYPAAVFLLLDQAGPLALAALFALVAGLRLVLARHLSKRAIALGLTAIAALCMATVELQSIAAIKLYPAAMSMLAAVWCAYTLYTPPSAIERLLNFAHNSGSGLPQRLRERIPLTSPDGAQGLSPSAAQLVYMRGLTLIWLGFFVVNAALAAATAFAMSTAVWALYSGCLSYLLMGVVLVAELLYRPVYQRRQEESEGGPEQSAVNGTS